jgi:hypothetical protein
MPLSPILAFEDHIRPAKLLLKLNRLLDADAAPLTGGELVEQLRRVTEAHVDEDLLVIHHALLTGVVRQRAEIHTADLKRGALKHLLRQAVVSACTALDAFLPALLRAHLPKVLVHRGRNFFPQGDKEVAEYFREVTFSITEVLAFQERSHDEAAEAISRKLLGLASFKYLGSPKGVSLTGKLLQLKEPWDAIADRLGQNREALSKQIDETARRRNDIAHRADRSSKDPDNPAQQEIAYALASAGVAAIDTVCHALDELVAERLRALRAEGPSP